MPRRRAAPVTPDELRELFLALSLWDKIHDGILSTVPYARTIGSAKHFPGGTSQMLGHYNARGAHACTTHQIIDPSGKILHWDEADIKAGDVTIAKTQPASQPDS